MKQLFEKIASLFKYRVVIIGLAFIVAFIILVMRVFTIQIIDGKSYEKGISSSIERVISTNASRGRIFDRNGVLLAYDELSYSVNVSDSGSYSSKAEKNATINSSIIETLRLIEANGDSYSNNFDISYKNGSYVYKVSGNSLLRFLRDCYGVAKVSDLSEEQKATKAGDLVNYLINTYQINTEGLEHNELIELLYLRINMTASSYARYKTFAISNEINNKTMAAILENSNHLTGITVDENYVRRYKDAKYYSALIGYTGIISSEQLSETKADGSNYESNDIVGKTGIEQIYNEDLSGKKGSKRVFLDTVGHITEVLSEEKATVGKDIYLTIDSRLQKNLYDNIEKQLTTIILEYLRGGNSKYSFNKDGSVKDIYILMNEVYFSLINNNLVKLSSIEEPTNKLEKAVDEAFIKQREKRLAWLKEEMTKGGKKYANLNDEDREYVWNLYEFLLKNNVISEDLIDTNDKTYEAWIKGDGPSLKDFIQYAISKNWIDMSLVTSESYTDLEGIYQAIIDYSMNNLKSDRSNSLLIFKEAINNGSITGGQMCNLLYEQGYLKKEGNLYKSLSSGSMPASSWVRSALSSKVITPGELGLYPSSGSGIVEDPSNGQLLACVSYPGYDSNKLTGTMDVDYYNGLQYNSSAPMLNWATQATAAPGSIYKLATAITALEEGVVTKDERIVCTGIYTEVVPSPKCWVYPSSHGSENVVAAIKDSCNVYFYTMGNRLARKKDKSYDSDYGTSTLKKYTDALGLSTISGIELPETAPRASDTNAISSAIGQGTHAYTNVNIARYVTTIANEGTVYNSSIILKVTDNDGKVIKENKPVVANKITDINKSTWTTVKEGMKRATATYPAFSSKSGLVACKTGTSQPSKLQPDNATFVSYAPLKNPEITLSIQIPFGYTSLNDTVIANNFYNYYFGKYSSYKDTRKGLPNYSSYVNSAKEN